MDVIYSEKLNKLIRPLKNPEIIINKKKNEKLESKKLSSDEYR